MDVFQVTKLVLAFKMRQNWAILDFDRNEYFSLFIDQFTGTVGFSTNGPNQSQPDDMKGNVFVADGTWHHIAVVYDGIEKAIYVDGALDKKTTTTPHNGQGLGKNGSANGVRYGYIGDGSESETFNGAGAGETGTARNNKWYIGMVDEVRMWSTVRTADEIAENRYRRLSGCEAGLELYYDFNESEGTAIYDKSNRIYALFTGGIDWQNSGSPLEDCASPMSNLNPLLADADCYRYGFNGMEKDDEIAGSGNSYTAEFWQYGSRLGRRWNQDPKPNPSISNYATFANNPIYYLDMLGDTVHRFNNKGIYLGMAELDIDGIRGSVGSYSTITGADGNEMQMWNSKRDFKFNDPSLDRDQMSFVLPGDKYLQFISDGNINDMMKRSGVEEMWFAKRARKAYNESTGGPMDFPVRYLDGEPSKSNNDMYGGFYLFDNSSTAYNVHDAGGYLWGNAMNRLGFDYSSAKIGSQMNEWFGDSDADQRAIRSGFHHTVTTFREIYFENAKVDHSP